MASYPTYDFTDSALNYDAVAITVIQMHSDLNNQVGCCKPPSLREAFDIVTPWMFQFPYEKANNTDRYKKNVQAAYEILYRLV